MKKIRIILLIFGLVFLAAKPALANNPPGPQMFLSELSILPLMMLLTFIGGGYAIISHLHQKKSRLPYILGIVLLILISMIHEGFSFLVILVFGGFAIIRSFRMIWWGITAHSSGDKPAHLTNAKPGRLIASGIAIIPATIFMISMNFAFLNYYPYTWLKEAALKNFITYQLAYARLQELKTGKMQFHKITDHNDPQIQNNYDNRNHFFEILGPLTKLEYGDDGKRFTIYHRPSAFPTFPFNYLTSQLTYYADETGQIRAIPTHWQDTKCPPDAPVMWKIAEQDIKDMMPRLNDYEYSFHLHIGVEYTNKNDYQKAADEFKKAIEANPNEAMGHYDLAVAYYHLEQWQKYIDELNITLSLDPNYPDAKKLLNDIQNYLKAKEQK